MGTLKRQFDVSDQWMYWHLPKIWWEQWRTPKTRYRKLVALGLEAERADKAPATGLGAWGNAGASHKHAAVKNGVLADGGS
jgi:RNA-directed DNA polymerase